MGNQHLRQHGRDGALRRPLKIHPVRKQLPHDVPNWVDPDEAVYFITICCQKRGLKQLTKSEISQRLLASIKYRHEKADWYMHFALLMPDHAHFIVSFPGRAKNLNTVISNGRNGPQSPYKLNGSVIFSNIDFEQTRASMKRLIMFGLTRCDLVW